MYSHKQQWQSDENRRKKKRISETIVTSLS